MPADSPKGIVDAIESQKAYLEASSLPQLSEDADYFAAQSDGPGLDDIRKGAAHLKHAAQLLDEIGHLLHEAETALIQVL
jgi:hypothetical protein